VVEGQIVGRPRDDIAKEEKGRSALARREIVGRPRDKATKQGTRRRAKARRCAPGGRRKLLGRSVTPPGGRLRPPTGKVGARGRSAREVVVRVVDASEGMGWSVLDVGLFVLVHLFWYVLGAKVLVQCDRVVGH